MAKANPFRFSTKYQDDESDLVMYPVRPYSPSIGRWLTRDPVEEQGGVNLCGFVQNDGVNALDPLGLATVRYEVVTGEWRGWTKLAGTWSQPWWAGSGTYSITPLGASSTVCLNNESSFWDHFFDVSGYCNTVWWSHNADPENIVGNAGAIKAYVKDDCGGRFRVSGMFFARLYGHGPQPVYARAWLYSATGATLTYAEANKRTPVQLAVAVIDMEITLSPKQEKLVADYEPYLRFNLNIYDGGQSSYGTAEGSLSITSVTKIQ